MQKTTGSGAGREPSMTRCERLGVPFRTATLPHSSGEVKVFCGPDIPETITSQSC